MLHVVQKLAKGGLPYFRILDINCGLYFRATRIYGHLRWPFFWPFGYGKILELVSICNSLNNSEGMTIFGRNDKNPEGITVLQKE